MFAEIGLDQTLLFPGATVTNADKSRLVKVYPLAIVHFATFPKEAHGIMLAIVDALKPVAEYEAGTSIDDIEPKDAVEVATVAITRLMLSSGFELLQACTVPPLADPTDDLAGPAVASWISQSIDPDYFDAEKSEYASTTDADDPDAEPAPSFRLKLGRLCAAGHKSDDILATIQSGFDGKPLPYPGWTLRQFEYWVKSDESNRARRQAEFSTAVAMAIGACLDTSGTGADAFKQYGKDLRSLN